MEEKIIDTFQHNFQVNIKTSSITSPHFIHYFPENNTKPRSTYF